MKSYQNPKLKNKFMKKISKTMKKSITKLNPNTLNSKISLRIMNSEKWNLK